METRTCNKCGHTGPLETDFPKNKMYAGGYRPQCKPCHNKAARQWQIDNPQKYAAIQNAHRERRGTEIRKKQREKFQKDPSANEKKNDMTRAWRERMKAEGKMESIKRRYSLVKYELSPAQYDVMLVAQNGVCAICKKVDPQGIPLAVDHDHTCCAGRKSCGKCVRGLLCSICNHMLGHAKDNIETLQSGIKYIKHHKAKHDPSIICISDYRQPEPVSSRPTVLSSVQ
jgi:Recombination endonuclease VII